MGANPADKRAADNIHAPQPPRPWELVAAVFAYLSVANGIPQWARMLQVTRRVPDCIKTPLLKANSSADFWISWAFLGMTAVLFAYLLWRDRSKQHVPEDRVDKTQTFRKQWSLVSKVVRSIRSFGFVNLRNYMLTKHDVLGYENIKRPSEWQQYPDRYDSVYRVHYKNGVSVEYQFPRDFHCLVVKKTPQESSIFGPEEHRPPKQTELHVLFWGSAIFPFWFPAYLLRKAWISLFN